MPLVHPGAGGDALALMRPQPATPPRGAVAAALGGGTSDSAIGQTVMSRDAMVACTTRARATGCSTSEVGGLLLEVGCAVSKFGTPLPISRNQSDPDRPAGAESSPSRAPIMLQAPRRGRGLRVHGPEAEGQREDLAKRQQNVELVKRRLMTVRQFLDEDGNPAPEITAKGP